MLTTRYKENPTPCSKGSWPWNGGLFNDRRSPGCARKIYVGFLILVIVGCAVEFGGKIMILLYERVEKCHENPEIIEKSKLDYRKILAHKKLD